jgi:outer membrane protein TolC
MRIRHAAIFILLLFATGACAQESIMENVSEGYLDTLIAVAKANYPKVKMNEARVNYAKADVAKSEFSYLDVFTFSYLYSPANTVSLLNQSATVPNSSNLINGYQVGVFMNIGTLFEKPAVVREAKRELDVVEYQKETDDLNLVAEVKKRYYAYLQQKAILRLRAKTLLDAESMVSDMKAKFERGEQTFDEYNKVLIAYSEHNQEKIITEKEVLTAKSDLEELLGEKLEDIK